MSKDLEMPPEEKPITSKKDALARIIYLAWMKDMRWKAEHIPVPRAYFWAELAAEAALKHGEK